MTIDLSCQKCEASFEIDAADVTEGLEKIKCPNCDAKAPQAMVEDFANAFSELCKAMSVLNKKFTVSLALESDDLPPPYDSEEDEEDEEESEEDELLDEDDDLLGEEDEEEEEEQF